MPAFIHPLRVILITQAEQYNNQKLLFIRFDQIRGQTETLTLRLKYFRKHSGRNLTNIGFVFIYKENSIKLQHGPQSLTDFTIINNILDKYSYIVN